MPYVILMTDKPDSAKLRADTRAVHVEYLDANKHMLLAAGALIEDDGTGGNASMYRLSEDADHRYALYVVAPAPGQFAPPHDHSTWAVIAGVHGRENNKLYTRTDDGTQPGVAQIEQSVELDVVPGTAIALMPDDIHSIHLGADGPHANLHLYGMSVEHCPERKMYSRSKGTYKIFPAATGVQKARGAD